MTFHIQDNGGPADQRVHTNQDNEQGREVKEQPRKGNIGGVNNLFSAFQTRHGYLSQVTAGVREYFNVMLSSQLLYRQERQQYDQLVKQVVLENKIKRDARNAKCQIIQNTPCHPNFRQKYLGYSTTLTHACPLSNSPSQ